MPLLRTTAARRTVLIAGACATASLVGLRRRPRMFVLGDSWAAGLHADPRHALGQVAAAALDWDVEVDAVSGTGYLNDAGVDGAYPTRMAARRRDASQVVLLQGGSNDDGLDVGRLPAAVRLTIDAARDRFAAAPVIMLGPGPDPEPVTAEQRRIDAILHATAQAARVPYISILEQRWIGAATAGDVIDAGNHHPTVAGQRYLGMRLAASLRRLCPYLRS